ncbi:MAG: Unknown protein [uncultured Sulfurovum sp.]|uniref:DUF11 domain-containing protein n=1 Tax=uncultured Sulfurovum sp. TaxID=269237 RepID=A0A6S6TK30_9BACT|nr:MAG: Unknown protein [uncultured Sulfurovum sp.]
MQKIIKYFILTTLFLFSSFLSALEVGESITNTASATYSIHGVDKNISSNTLAHIIEESDASITFMTSSQNGTQTAVLGISSYRDANGVWREGDASSLGNDTPLSLEDTEVYGVEDTVIISVTDADRNANRLLREVIEVTVTTSNGDTEVLSLRETSENSGIFVAYIVLSSQVGTSYDNRLYVQNGDTLVANYENSSINVKSDTAVVMLDQDLNIWIEKQVNKTASSVGELLEYTLVVHNDEEFPVSNLTIQDALPLGVKYEKTVANTNGETFTPTFSDDAKTVFFAIDKIVAGESLEIKFIASVTAGVQNRQVVNQAWVTQNNGFKSNVATVTTLINEELMRSKGIIMGQVYDAKEKAKARGVAGVRLYLENGLYVVTDEAGKYHFDGIEAGNHIIQVDKALLPQGYKMGKCEENARNAGSDFSQFVKVGQGALKRVNFCVERNGELVETKTKEAYVIPTKVETMPTYGVKDLEQADKREILWPPVGYVPFIPSTKIAVKHAKNERIDICLNGQRVSKMNYSTNVTSKKSKNVIDIYTGVDLLERGNIIKVEYFDKANKLLETLSRKVHVSSAPVQVRYMKENSYTVADGKNSPVIAVKFLDDAGQPLRAGMTGTFSIDAPYASQEYLEQLKKNPLALSSAQNRYTVHSDGIAYIKLQPTTESGEVTLHFQLQERDEVIRAWLKPELREWIMVGFAEGTVGYNTLKGNRESLGEIGAEDKTITEGRVSFFAKGKVKGDWLMSMAYDTGKDTSQTEFFDEIDPNAYYTLYNDNSQQNQEAASREKLYVKLEKEQFNILFGDYSTDLSYTELSAYSRRFTGVKSEYHGEHVEAKAFVSHTEQLFIKDEIRGDGTSGYYYLKSKNMLQFSEQITIEVRDRYRTEEIVSSTSLQRFKDYEIDYALGRLYFKEPIYSTDETFNPRFIVVDYEVNGDAGKYYTYGGRTAIKVLEDKVEIGATYISEDSSKKSSELMGADARVEIAQNTTVKAEYAKTKTVEEASSSQGEAKLAAIEHVSNGVYVRAYFREQESAFGLGQLSDSLGATRKVGLDVSQQLDNRQTNRLSLYRDSDLLNKTDADVMDFRTEFASLNWNVYGGYRYSKVSTDEEMAQQLLLGGSYGFFDQRLKLSALREQTLSDTESELFPTKTMVGLDYALNASMDFFSAYEWTDNLEQGRAGVRVRPWSGMTVENTTLSEYENDNQNVYNTLGGLQTLQVSEKVGVNVGYEKGQVVQQSVASLLLDDNITEMDKAFSAYRLGVNYNGEDYSATLNGEIRKGSSVDKVNLSSAVYTQTSDSLAVALSATHNKETGKNRNQTDSNARFSLAYRPEEDGMIVLEKLDFISSKSSEAQNDFVTEKMINNLNVNLTPTTKSEVALQHGLKYVADTINDYEYKGFTQLLGIDARYDMTKTWELGVQGSLLYAQSANNMDYGFGLYSGHNLFDNMVLTLGYNWKGFEERDFSLQTYRMEGAYFRFNMKFDQESLKDTVRLMSW